MRLHTYEYGDPSGPPLICLHGVTGHGERFRKLGEEALSDRRVLAFDFRAHGRSAGEPPWDMETHVADVLETASALGVQRADWMGFSYGGRVAAGVAAQVPDRVASLILLDPALHMPPEIALEQAQEERGELSFGSVDEAIADRGASLVSTPRELLEEEMRQNLVQGDDGRWRYRHEPVAGVAIWSDMAREAPPVADVPTLIVRGEESWVPIDVSRYPDARVVTVRGTHPVLWEDFDGSVAAIREFLAGQA